MKTTLSLKRAEVTEHWVLTVAHGFVGSAVTFTYTYRSHQRLSQTNSTTGFDVRPNVGSVGYLPNNLNQYRRSAPPR